MRRQWRYVLQRCQYIHTIRTVINDDEKFRQILRGLGKDFYHQTVTTKQIEDYISKNLALIF